MHEFNESDWKYLRKIQEQMLNRLCDKLLDKLNEETKQEARKDGSHKQYLKVYRLLKELDDEIAVCFNDWRRSTILTRLLAMKRLGVISEQEVNGLSEETKRRLFSILENWQ